MAAGATYDKIATTTLGSAASSITFSSIAASWTDLRLVLVDLDSNTSTQFIQFNGSTATNYSFTLLAGNGTAASSTTLAGIPSISLGSWFGASTTIPNFSTVDIFSYAGSTYKTSLVSNSYDANGSGGTYRSVALWSSTAAITSILISRSTGTFNTGTTATLYGIKAA